MPITLFHGDDTTASRSNLYSAKTKLGSVIEVSGDKITPKELETTLIAEGLFGTDPIVIENLFSRTRSKDKDACIALLLTYEGSRDILCWDKKALTKAVTAKLPKSWKVVESKLPAILFNFLDSLYPTNINQSLELFHQLLSKHYDPGLIFAMLSRHIISLIQAQSATSLKLPPWQIGKLKGQARMWSEPGLIHFLDELYRIDLQIKTGATKLDLGSQLDILLLQVLG